MSKEAMTLALEALRNAIFDEHTADETLEAIKALEEAIAKQEQGEPVAWRNAAIRVGEDLCSVGPFGYYDMTAEQWLDWALSVVTVHFPPQPAQKPLTDEQIEGIARITCIGISPHEDTINFVRAIEAAHGIKENT
jgi:hypothetical protein